MKKTLIAAGLGMALMGTNASALTGIQIDPTGTGSISNSFVANNLGSDFGDLLFQSLFNAVGGNAGTVYMHNVFDLGSLDGGELTFTAWMEVEASPGSVEIDGIGTFTDPNNVTFTNPAGYRSYFALFYDPLTNANHDTGAGYDDGVKLATGTISIDLTAGISHMTLGLTAGSNVALDGDAGAVNSAIMNGNAFLNVEFDSLPGLGTYLINSLVTLDVDLEVNGGTKTPYTDVLASDTVGGTTDDDGLGDDRVGAVLDPGTDVDNDFTCSLPGDQNLSAAPAVDQDCDAQVQVTSVLDFNAASVPEPTGLALIGAGLGIAGFLARRKRRA